MKQIYESNLFVARRGYYDVRKNSIDELLRPHLVIYLDVPVNKILQNVKNRAISYEKNSPVLTPEYLGVMERTYKQNFLKTIRWLQTDLCIQKLTYIPISSQQTCWITSLRLVAGRWCRSSRGRHWTHRLQQVRFTRCKDEGLGSVVGGRLEHTTQQVNNVSWIILTFWQLLVSRYSDGKNFLLTYLNVPLFDIPEYIIPGEDAEVANKVFESVCKLMLNSQGIFTWKIILGSRRAVRKRIRSYHGW